MRSLAAFVGLLCIMLVSRAGAAPPPPPPPPPQDLPASLDGYPTAPIWSSYALWVIQRLGEAREMALEQRPAQLSESYYRSVLGPRSRAYTNEPGGEMFGSDMRLEQWCPSGGAGNCIWFARRALNLNHGEAWQFAREHFNIERAVAFLHDAGVPPAAIDAWAPRSYGLPDPLAYGAERDVEFSEVSDNECDAVPAALTVTEGVRAQLSVTHQRPRTGSPPPPPPPHSGIVELILPTWYVQRRGAALVSGADLVIYGMGPGTMASDLAQMIFGPVENCLQMRRD